MVEEATGMRNCRDGVIRDSERVLCRSGLRGEVVVVTTLVRQSVVAQLARQDMELAQAPHIEVNPRGSSTSIAQSQCSESTTQTVTTRTSCPRPSQR